MLFGGGISKHAFWDAVGGHAKSLYGLLYPIAQLNISGFFYSEYVTYIHLLLSRPSKQVATH